MLTADIFPPNKYGRFGLKAFRRMFRAVGRRFSPDVVCRPNWYLESSWTMEQERTYREWFVRQASRDLGWDKRRARKESGWFLLFYGWRIEAPENISHTSKNHQAKAKPSLAPRNPGHGVQANR